MAKMLLMQQQMLTLVFWQRRKVHFGDIDAMVNGAVQLRKVGIAAKIHMGIVIVCMVTTHSVAVRCTLAEDDNLWTAKLQVIENQQLGEID